MKIAKTLAAAALCLSVCSAAFAAPAVKTFDENMAVPFTVSFTGSPSAKFSPGPLTTVNSNLPGDTRRQRKD